MSENNIICNKYENMAILFTVSVIIGNDINYSTHLMKMLNVFRIKETECGYDHN